MFPSLSHQASTQPLPSNIDAVVERILCDRKITRADQYCLMNVLLSKHALSLDDHSQINRVFDALRRGVIRVID